MQNISVLCSYVGIRSIVPYPSRLPDWHYGKLSKPEEYLSIHESTLIIKQQNTAQHTQVHILTYWGRLMHKCISELD